MIFDAGCFLGETGWRLPSELKECSRRALSLLASSPRSVRTSLVCCVLFTISVSLRPAELNNFVVSFIASHESARRIAVVERGYYFSLQCSSHCKTELTLKIWVKMLMMRRLTVIEVKSTTRRLHVKITSSAGCSRRQLSYRYSSSCNALRPTRGAGLI